MNAIRGTSIALTAAVVASYISDLPAAVTVALTAALVVTTSIDVRNHLQRRSR